MVGGGQDKRVIEKGKRGKKKKVGERDMTVRGIRQRGEEMGRVSEVRAGMGEGSEAEDIEESDCISSSSRRTQLL